MKQSGETCQILATSSERIFPFENEQVLSEQLQNQIHRILDGEPVSADSLTATSTLFRESTPRVIAKSALESWHPEFFGPAGPMFGPMLPRKAFGLSEFDPSEITGGRRAPSRRVRHMTEQELDEYGKRDRLIQRFNAPTIGLERAYAVAAGGLLAVTLALGVANDHGYTEPAEIIDRISKELTD